MKKASISLVILVIIIIAFLAYLLYPKHSVPTNASSRSEAASSTSSVMTTSTSSTENWKTYDNFGIQFKYPAEWAVPTDRIFGDLGIESIWFAGTASDTQGLDVLINPISATGLIPPVQTFDQMIGRFNANNPPYSMKDIMVNGLSGKEMVYKSAVSGEPYDTEAYFPIKDGYYLTIGADFDVVPQATIDQVISTLKLDPSSDVQKDPADGFLVYSNNGMRFEYPKNFNTAYGSLSIEVSVQDTDSSKLDANGCYPQMLPTGRLGSSTIVLISTTRFCSDQMSDVGAGQLYTGYNYTTFKDGKAYLITYEVHRSNGCGAYENSSDLSSPDNAKYRECLDFGKNYAHLVGVPIQKSISTFQFTSANP